MLLAATSDIHWDKRLEKFKKGLKEIKKPDALFLAGDMTRDGNIKGIKDINEILKPYDFPVFSCFGNEEYNEIHEELLSMEEITYLNDEAIRLNLEEDIVIIGTKGSLDRPTYWQRNNVPGIKKKYKERVEKIRELLLENSDCFRILFMHYTPTYKTLKGEDRRRWPEMGSKKMENMIKEEQPELVIHGHAHNGEKHAKIGATPVYNVAFPVWNKIMEIDTEKLQKRRLDSF